MLGPGFVVAATGVGAGDLIAGAVAGSRYGLVALWAVALGAIFKWVLNEGIARWQFATDTSIIEGWSRRLPGVVRWYFLGFLLLWSFLVAGALISACGVATHALVPAISIRAGGAGHAVAGLVLVLTGGYGFFERVMKALIAIMFAVVIACAILIHPDIPGFLHGLLVPTVPTGGAKFLLGVMGGVGGSVTLLCYGYWIRETGWSGASGHRRSLFDLTIAYATTGFFGLALIVIAASSGPANASGTGLVLALADQLGDLLGPVGRLCFLIGFWCAVATSLLGVWQGVPYLFADTLKHLRRQPKAISDPPDDASAKISSSAAYRWYLAYLALPPMALLLFDRPILVVVVYAVAGSFFMPFLASALLIMNNQRKWVGPMRNPWAINVLLALSLVLFAWLFVSEAFESLAKL